MNQTNSSRTLIAHIQNRLQFPQCDIAAMRANRLNSAYPVISLVFAQIEYIASLLYPETSSTRNAGSFIQEYMGRVNSLYSIQFSKKYPLANPAKGRTAGSFGELLYQTLRCKIVHQGGCYPPFSVTAKEEHWSYHLQFNCAERQFLVHAYRFNTEFEGALQMLFSQLEQGMKVEEIRKGIIQEQEELRSCSRLTEPILDEMERCSELDLGVDHEGDPVNSST